MVAYTADKNNAPRKYDSYLFRTEPLKTPIDPSEEPINHRNTLTLEQLIHPVRNEHEGNSTMQYMARSHQKIIEFHNRYLSQPVWFYKIMEKLGPGFDQILEQMTSGRYQHEEKHPAKQTDAYLN